MDQTIRYSIHKLQGIQLVLPLQKDQTTHYSISFIFAKSTQYSISFTFAKSTQYSISFMFVKSTQYRISFTFVNGPANLQSPPKPMPVKQISKV